MKPQRQELLQITVGAIVFCFVIGAVALIFGSDRLFGNSRSELHATFGKVDGLKVGAQVMAAGVPVGQIVSLRLTDDFRAAATMRIDPGVRLDVDSSAAVVTDGLFGEKFVRLDIGGADRMISDGGTIGRTEEPVIVDELLGQIIAIGEANLKKRKAE
jgi:phospholipid/cholesterol/gamma-HCH transport system substrate-binding protein